MNKFIDKIHGYLIESNSKRMFMNIETGEYFGCRSKKEAKRYFANDSKIWLYDPRFIELTRH